MACRRFFMPLSSGAEDVGRHVVAPLDMVGPVLLLSPGVV